MITLRESTIATVSYADVFDYPLTEEELKKWLVKGLPAGKAGAKLKTMKEIKNADGYFFLKGRKRIVSLRKIRCLWARGKMRWAQRAAGLLTIIPTVKLVGVTGALAVENAHKDDDIDFYIVAAAGTLWATRFFATTLLALFDLRRKPGDTSFRNKICLNMYVDENHLAVRSKERDLFTAHEVLQMKPLWERNHTYAKFLGANTWVKKFLPNAWRLKTQDVRLKTQEKTSSRFSLLTSCFIEPLLRTLQLWYMQRHRSTEVVTDTLIRFHPADARKRVRVRFGATLARYKIPLDKIFYRR